MQTVESFITTREREAERNKPADIASPDVDGFEQFRAILHQVTTPQLRRPRYRKLVAALANQSMEAFEAGDADLVRDEKLMLSLSRSFDLLCAGELIRLGYLVVRDEGNGHLSVRGSRKLQREYGLSLPPLFSLHEQDAIATIAQEGVEDIFNGYRALLNK